MTQKKLADHSLKQAMKEAVAETLHEHRELLHDVFAEVLEDFALAQAIHQGQKTKRATRKEVFEILQATRGRPPSERVLRGT